MQNRVMNYFAPSGAPDYWLVRGNWGWVMVTREVAMYLQGVLRRRLRPRWVRFCDLSGSEICLRTSTIDLIGENTAAQRANDRALRRQLDAEDNGGDEWQDFRTA
ncbi:MAG TPA: hypothetical protein VGD27_09670 [Longimicrobiales bacterium]